MSICARAFDTLHVIPAANTNLTILLSNKSASSVEGVKWLMQCLRECVTVEAIPTRWRCFAISSYKVCHGKQGDALTSLVGASLQLVDGHCGLCFLRHSQVGWEHQSPRSLMGFRLLFASESSGIQLDLLVQGFFVHDYSRLNGLLPPACQMHCDSYLKGLGLCVSNKITIGWPCESEGPSLPFPNHG